MSPALRSHFDEYAGFHRTAGNRVCHSFGIPIIVLASLALLCRVPVFDVAGFAVSAAEVMIVLLSLYYVVLDVPLAALMLALYFALDALGRFIPPWPAAGLFVLGWILQGVGHYVYEKNSPAFFRNLAHLALGQLWILAKATRRA